VNKKGNPATLKSWKKGQSGNPDGAKKLRPELLEIKNYNGDEVKRLISKYFRMPWEEIQLTLEDTTRPAIELAFASAINKSIALGDVHRIIPLLERLIGKVKDEAQDVNINLQQVSTIELIQLGRQAIQVLEGETVEHTSLIP
jgi:hypothetical protein